MKFSILLLFLQLLQPFLLSAQQPKSTGDLSFLIGRWETQMVYSPGTADTRTNTGYFECKYVLDSTFIKCAYEFERPGRKRALNDAYFNYNSITDVYEILWISSTWPVKVLQEGDLEIEENQLKLTTNAEFPIENGITEYVRGEWVFERKTKSYKRKTHIRTSKDPVNQWRYHSIEIAKMISIDK